MTKNIIFLAVFMMALLGGLPRAYAVDSTSEAGAEATRFQQEKKYNAMMDRVEQFSEEKADIEAVDDEGLSEDEKKIRFEVKSIQITGNETISSEELNGLVQDEVGQEAGLTDLRRIADKVKKYYRDRGYIAAYAYVPPQTIDGGHVEIAVVEGVLEKVEIKNNRWFSDKTLRRFIPLAAGQILYLRELQSALIFLNKHKDIKVKSYLKPGDTPQTTKLELDVKERFPIHFSADVNNLGTDNTGRTRVGLGISFTNLTGNMDELSSRFQIGTGAMAVGADYSIPVHSSGTRLGLGYSYSHIHLGGDFKQLAITGDAHTYSAYILQPLVRRDWIDLTFNTGMDFKEIENDILGTPVGKDALRIWNIGINTEFTDRWGKTFFPHSVHIGFSSFLGASDKVSNGATRVGTGGQFFAYRSSLLRFQRLPFGMTYVFRGQMQLTNDRLAPSEQIRLGGAFSVRGYAEGEYLADYGAFMTNEIYIPTYFFPKDWKLPYSKQPLREQIQGVAFFDFGGGELRAPRTGEKEGRTLAGAGIGVRMRLFDKVFARLQWATPTGSDARNGDDSVFYYGVTTEFI
ncbi:MAG TPA: ShlB/FhaC/HecB family hemolysin secretion/activation protein [Candidatus Omnitrophota bacterium]|nr:ShlB/FhaC/HecB family hemolysin secretion/activation protein [Candidatus Omnitrophota bacterium]